jgi:hypothetical protein
MIDGLAALIVGEGNWLPLAMFIALAFVSVDWRGQSRSAARDRVMTAMNRFVGVTLLVMGIGHLLAVTTKAAQGSLNGSLGLLYVIGVAIVIPSVWIIVTAHQARAATANGWLAATLVVLGLINIPLAIPALLNIAYSMHVRARTGSVIVGAFLVVNAALFFGGMLFLLSGARTFEEFRM